MKLLTVSAATTDEGSEFQSFTIFVLKAFLQMSVFTLGLYSFHLWPHVNSESFLFNDFSGDTLMSQWNNWYTITMSPRRQW